MRAYTLSHLGDQELLRNLSTLVAQDRVTTAELLAHIAEVDKRQLYLPAAYPSMRAYCEQELRMSEDAAAKRIQAARAARNFPAIFEAVAGGRMSLSAVVLLAPHLSQTNAAGLLDAAYGKSKFEIQQLIAGRFPRTEPLPLVQAFPISMPMSDLHAPGHAITESGQSPRHSETEPAHVETPEAEPAPGRVSTFINQPTSLRVAHAVPRTTLKPHAQGRYALQLTIAQTTYDKLQHAQALLSHALPSGEIAEVLDRALDALIAKLERRKFGAAEKPRTPRRAQASTNPRAIPAHIRRAVVARDGKQCTFTGASGQRCRSRRFLEFDHVEPVASGGQATIDGLRLRCRAHNQYEAERTFGAAFMQQKRDRVSRTAH